MSPSSSPRIVPSAPRPPAVRVLYGALLGNLHDAGEGRKLAPAELKARLSKGPFLAAEAQKAGLIDTLAFQDEIDRVVSEMMGGQTHVVDDAPLPRAHAGQLPTPIATSAPDRDAARRGRLR